MHPASPVWGPSPGTERSAPGSSALWSQRAGGAPAPALSVLRATGCRTCTPVSGSAWGAGAGQHPRPSQHRQCAALCKPHQKGRKAERRARGTRGQKVPPGLFHMSSMSKERAGGTQLCVLKPLCCAAGGQGVPVAAGKLSPRTCAPAGSSIP